MFKEKIKSTGNCNDPDRLSYMRATARKDTNPLNPFFRHSCDLHNWCTIDNKPKVLQRVISEKIISVTHDAGYFYKVHTTRRTFPVVFSTEYLAEEFGALPEANDFSVIYKGKGVRFFGKTYSIRDLGYVFSGGACYSSGVCFTYCCKKFFDPCTIIELCLVAKNKLAYLFADRFYGEAVYSKDYAYRMNSLYSGFSEAMETGKNIFLTQYGLEIGDSGEEFSDDLHQRESFNYAHSNIDMVE